MQQQEAPTKIVCIAENSKNCPCALAAVCGKKPKPQAPIRLTIEIQGEIPGFTSLKDTLRLVSDIREDCTIRLGMSNVIITDKTVYPTEVEVEEA